MESLATQWRAPHEARESEQNTRVVLRDDVCRDIARWGEPYNPYKPPAQPQQAAPLPYGAGEQRPEVGQQQGAPAASTVGYAPGQRADQFPRSPGYKVSTFTAPTTTL